MKNRTVTMSRSQVETIRAFLGRLPHDDIVAGCAWIDQALVIADATEAAQASEPTQQEVPTEG